MLTVKELSNLSDVTVRTLHYYDELGLVKPSAVTDAGYRLYGDDAVKKLQKVMLLKELGVPLKNIKVILGDENCDIIKVIESRLKFLKLEKQRLEKIISFAENIVCKGDFPMDFSPFNKNELKKFQAEAKEKWGATPEFSESKAKEESRTEAENLLIANGLVAVFTEFGKIKDGSPSSDSAVSLCRKLQNFISENYYNCNNEILASLGIMYINDPRFKENIDNFGGNGTAQFVSDAIKAFNINYFEKGKNYEYK